MTDIDPAAIEAAARVLSAEPNTDLIMLLHLYGLAFEIQTRRPSDDGQTDLGRASRMIRAHVEAREAAARADERERIAREIEATFARWERGEITRPQYERGGFLNDRDWCLAIARRDPAQDDAETQMARKPAESALGATDGVDGYTGEGGGSEGESGRRQGGPVHGGRRIPLQPGETIEAAPEVTT